MYVILGGLLAWSYWPVLLRLVHDWRTNDDYSAGALVPMVAAYIAWSRREKLAHCKVAVCWWGAAMVLGAMAMRIFGQIFFFQSAERYSLVLMVIGLVLLLAGREVARRMLWVLVFLFLMVPIPTQVHALIAGPLQNWATYSAALVLEGFGTAVLREGNILFLEGDLPVGVAEACSGLRMLTAFAVVAAILSLVIQRPLWQKWILLLSSVPVAVLCNLLRLVVTSWVYLTYDDTVAERFFHDFAGMAMMPIAIAILYAEVRIMDLLVVADDGSTTGRREKEKSVKKGNSRSKSLISGQ